MAANISNVSAVFEDGNQSVGNDSAELGEFRYPHLTRVVEVMDTYYVPSLIIVGLLANLLSFLVFVSTYLNRLSLSVYLAALAVADSGCLWSLGVAWFDYVGIALFHTNGWCQVTIYINYVCSFLSAWLVVSFMVERYIAISYPLKRPEMCTVKRAKIVVLSLYAFPLLSYSIILKITGVSSDGAYTICYALVEYHALYLGLTYTDAIMTFLLPFCVIVGLNIKISANIAYFYKARKNDPTMNHIYCPTTNHGHLKTHTVCQRNRAQVEMTKFLLIKSTVFLVINVPVYVIRVIAFVNNVTEVEDSRLDILLQQLFQFLVYLNFSINFFLYNICSKKFREGLMRLFQQVRYKCHSLSCQKKHHKSIKHSMPILQDFETKTDIVE